MDNAEPPTLQGLTRTDQNFKAPLLEAAVRSQPSVLPTNESCSFDGTSKRFDPSFALGDTLLVVECKAKSWSLGFERGDISAVVERTRHVTEILRQIVLALSSWCPGKSFRRDQHQKRRENFCAKLPSIVPFSRALLPAPRIRSHEFFALIPVLP